jgi:hypothetical protein
MSRKNYLGFIIVLLAVLALLPGCASNRAIATIDPTTDLSTLKVLHVKKYSEDTRNTKVIIEKKLVNMGFQVSKTEGDADAIVTYIDKWFWDITFYMIELTVTLREPKTDFPLASGNSYHTSLTRKSPEGMVDEVLTNIFFSKQK